MIIQRIKRDVNNFILKQKFKKKNKNASVYLDGTARIDNISIGDYTYGPINALTFNDSAKLKIGNFCSIAPRVSFLVSADHYVNHISSYPFKVRIMGESFEGYSKGDIIVDDDVWIGYGATILSGVHIGQGAVIAAGAVVSKDVPPYAIVGGVPASLIKYRFEPEMIEELLQVDYSKLTRSEIEKHIDELYAELKDKSQLEWMPRKNM